MKAQIVHGLAATREAVKQVFGRKVGARFVANPLVTAYAAALRFPETKVRVSGELRRALRKAGVGSGPILALARDLTLEARRDAAEARCDVLNRRRVRLDRRGGLRGLGRMSEDRRRLPLAAALDTCRASVAPASRKGRIAHVAL